MRSDSWTPISRALLPLSGLLALAAALVAAPDTRTAGETSDAAPVEKVRRTRTRRDRLERKFSRPFSLGPPEV